MREAQVNLAIRWFAGYGLEDVLPHASSLTRIRRRWGAEKFKAIFKRTVQNCAKKGLVSGKTVHVDATLIRADVSWESLSTDYADRVLQENEEEEDRPGVRNRPGKKRSCTDPDASMATSKKGYRLEPSYKQHTAVDDCSGVVLDVDVTTGEASEGRELSAVIERVEETTGMEIEKLTADAGYSHPKNYALLEGQKIDAIIPPQRESGPRGNIPLSRFKYDSRQCVVRCPGGKVLKRSSRHERGWIYRAKRADCRACAFSKKCFSATASSRIVVIVDGYEALLRARRRRRRWGDIEYGFYSRHHWRVEGAHAEAKTRHGLRRAARRGLWNMAIQSYLTAAVMNLKRLAALIAPLFWLSFVKDRFGRSLRRSVTMLTHLIELSAWQRREVIKTGVFQQPHAY